MGQLKISLFSSCCFLVLLLASAEGSLAFLCSRNPSALPGLCRNYLQSCPAVTWGEWKLTGYSPSSASNSSCTSAQKLLRFTRTKDVSKLSVTCRSQAGATSETEDRCPPTTQQKVSALVQALGNDFGSGSPVTGQGGPTGGGWSFGRRRRRRSPPPPPPPTCRYADPRDLAIVIDSSGSVGRIAFDKAVNTLGDFINHMCHKFECAGPETRFAVLTYGSQVREVFNFHHSGTYHRTKARIIADIKSKATYLYQFAGATATGTALEHCRDRIFQTSTGMRSNSKRTILLLTDGRSNRGTPPGQVATQLHSQMGVDIYALGIGGNVDVVELQSITKQKNPVNLLYLLLFNGFEEFFEIEKIIKDDLDQSGLQCKAAKKIYDKKK